MPYSMNWFIKGRVIDCCVSGMLTLEDVIGIRREAAEIFIPDAQPPFLHTLFDITALEKFQFQLKELLESQDQTRDSQNIPLVGAGWRIYYGRDDRVFRFLMSIFHQSRGHRTKWFPNRPEAITFLADSDDTILDHVEDV